MKSTVPAIEPNLFIVMITLGVAMLVAIVASAHEIGKTQVQAVLRDGAYEIDVVVDPDALLPTLEAYGQRTISRDLPRDERDRRIAALAGVFLERAAVSFDGRVAAPGFEYVPASAFNDYAQAPSKVRLRGTVPAGASELTFTYGLALGTYALNARIGDGPVQTQWVVGGAPSAPVSLSAPLPPPTRAGIGWQYFTLGFTHILPHGFDHDVGTKAMCELVHSGDGVVAAVVDRHIGSELACPLEP